MGKVSRPMSSEALGIEGLSVSSTYKKALYRAKAGFVLAPNIGTAHAPLPDRG